MAKAREETGISLYFLKELCKESGIPPCKTPKFDEETKRRALDMIAEYGMAETRDRMGIQWQTLTKWMKKAGIQQGGKKRYYDAETKHQALEMVDKIGFMATSRAMGISTTTLKEWRKDELWMDTSPPVAGLPPVRKKSGLQLIFAVTPWFFYPKTNSSSSSV